MDNLQSTIVGLKTHYKVSISRIFTGPYFFYKFKHWFYRFFGWGVNYVFYDYNKTRSFCFYSAIKKNPQVKSFAYYYYTEAHTNFLPHTFKWYSFLLYNSYIYNERSVLLSKKLGLFDFDALSLMY